MRIRDDRDELRTLVGRADLRALRRIPGLRRAILRHETIRTSVILLIMLALTIQGGWMGGWVGGLVITRFGRDPWDIVGAVALGAVAGFALSIAAVVKLDDVLTARLVDKFKSLRRCPSCGYDLTGLVPESSDGNGCTICPECGAAWRLPNIPPLHPATLE
jgi:hypothetical protein